MVQRLGTTRWARRSMMVAAFCAALLGVGLLSAPAQAAADPVVRDGSRYDKAAASCWAIKQVNPAAGDGVYWLQTPKLINPQQFYCDQTTDGGGWVLVGRGRDGWTFAGAGQGSQATLRNTPTGTGAFAPAALPGGLIDGLLNGQGVNSTVLPEGIRVRRAANATGTAWQEIRYHTQPLTTWSWAFGGGIKLNSVSLDGRTLQSNGLTTRDVTVVSGNSSTQIFTYENSEHCYRMGFSYGYAVSGANNSSSYLWQCGSERKALPFTQVWLRPKFTSLSYDAPALSGAAAIQQRALMATKTSTATPWGVTGVVGGGTGEQNIEVQSLGAVGNTMFVGGKFEYVQKGANPAAGEKIRQPYLAAFDVTTGAWKSDFRPVLNGQVWDIQASPSGSLIITGEFSSVNGAPNTRGLAALDATTGQVQPGWRAALSNGASSTRGRAVDIQGDWLYVGGTFNQVVGGVGAPKTVKVKNLARVKVTDGTPDLYWRPLFNGAIMELDASARGDRVYVTGHFSRDADSNYIQARGAAAVTTSRPSTLVPGWKQYETSTANATYQYQQMVREVGDFVWQGGSQHVLQKYNRDTFELLKSNITRKGGDFQTAVEINGVVYAGCHCEHYTYSDAITYDSSLTGGLPPAYSRPDSIEWIGAWDAATGEFLPDWTISGLRSRAGNGPWEMIQGPDKCLWFGGDMNRGTYSGSGYQWLGGFGKVCPGDTTVPTKPSSLSATRTSTGVNLSWPVATDNAGTVRYEVLRNDRVLVNTSSTRYTDAGAPVNATYWVRAVDGAGNRSATTAGVTR